MQPQRGAAAAVDEKSLAEVHNEDFHSRRGRRNHRQDRAMTTSIFVNVPVYDLEASKAFYTALGYSINPNFTDETAAHDPQKRPKNRTENHVTQTSPTA
jgi:hypothetical protein